MRAGRAARVGTWYLCAIVGVACGGSSKAAMSVPGGTGGMADSASERSAPMAASSEEDDGGYQVAGPGGGGLAPTAPGAPAQPAPTPAPAGQPGQVATDQPVTPQPLLIYTAMFHLAVFETVAAIDTIELMARKRGGYLVQRTDAAIVIRVPAPQFHDAVTEVGGLGDVLHREVSVQDVTAEFRDLELRLRNLYAVRDRVEKLLAQSKNVHEALEVERELERITTAIEQMKGRLKYLSELIAFSTIHVNFQPRPTDQVSSEVKLPFDWLDDLGLPRLLDLAN